MVEIKTIDGSVLFSYDENTTTLKEEIVKHKDLRNANLQGVDLKGVNFWHVDLREADLSGADLSGANLSNANLSGAYLYGTNLRNADLRGADLREADLRKADLYCADLRNADLSRADLEQANLSGADLEQVDFRDANFKRADLNGAKNPPDLPMACPKEGSFIAWKKVNKRFIIKLEIPSDAKRSSATTERCRCSKAMVLKITNILTQEEVDKIVNYNHTRCVYEVGEMVYPDSFNEDRWDECSNGIHFFMTEEEAVNYH